MMIIQPKHILYITITAMAFLCSSVQDSKACCCGSGEEEETRPLLNSLPAKKNEDLISVDKQPSASPSSLTSHSDSRRYDFSNMSMMLGSDPCNTTTGSSGVSPLVQVGVQEFLEAEETIISYLKKHLETPENDLRTEYNEKSFFLSATIPGGDYAIFLTYLPENSPSRDLVEPCFRGQIEKGKSIKHTFISSKLRNHIETNYPAAYQKLAGTLLFVHEQARVEGKIYSVTGQNEYSESIFDIRGHRKIPSSYPYLYVITGKSTSSTLLKKKNAFFAEQN